MAKSKLQRDPGAPKRNISAYLLYQNAKRDEFKAVNPDMTFGQLAKYTSAMYAEIPAPEKEAWMERAKADKQRYLHELSSYVPPAGFNAKGDEIVLEMDYGAVKPTRRSGKVEKDINAPKRNMSAYLLYQNAMRDSFRQENPSLTFGQLAKFTSGMYKNLTQEEKATWMAKAEEDKKRYDDELAQYVPPPGHDARGKLIDDQSPKRRNKRDPNAPKRASGAYVFFTNGTRPVVMQQYPGIKFVDMGRILGERWRALTAEEKATYEKMASEDKVRYQQDMQQYTANQAAKQQIQAMEHIHKQMQEQQLQQHQQLQQQQMQQLQEQQQQQMQQQMQEMQQQMQQQMQHQQQEQMQQQMLQIQEQMQQQQMQQQLQEQEQDQEDQQQQQQQQQQQLQQQQQQQQQLQLQQQQQPQQQHAGSALELLAASMPAGQNPYLDTSQYQYPEYNMQPYN